MKYLYKKGKFVIPDKLAKKDIIGEKNISGTRNITIDTQSHIFCDLFIYL